ncbi:MAG TPA: rhomboid family intramembrane serine protease [Candidatus Polarisedimenticolia bacterium]|nr:rhomboid family intramembrane serine protease [Candidatus Polarisedimenticolia bacterium]
MYYLFYIPVGTEARVRHTPWGTIALVGANLVAFLYFQYTPGAEPDFYRFMLYPGASSLFTSITSSFLHVGWLHLVTNLIYLGIFAPAIESRVGTFKFLASYLCFAGLANLAQAAWMLTYSPELASMPILGASGAVAGVMGLFLVRLYFVRLKFTAVTLLYFQGVTRVNKIALPAFMGIILWFVLQAVYQLSQPVEGTAYISHLTGLTFGVALGLLMGLPAEGRLERRLIIGDRYAERGEWYAALGEYEAYLQKRPEDDEVLIRVARVQRVTHQTAASQERFRETIACRLKSGDVEGACDAFDEMKRLLGDVPIPSGYLLRIARCFEEKGRPSDASRAYESYGRHYPDASGATTALLKCIDIERRVLNNPGRAQYVCQELLRRELPAEVETLAKERMEQILAQLVKQRIVTEPMRKRANPAA